MYLSEAVRYLKCRCDLLSDKEFDTLNSLGDCGDDRKLLIYVENEKYFEKVRSIPSVSCVICSRDLADRFLIYGYGICTVDNPKRAFFEIHNHLCCIPGFYSKTVRHISESAKIYESSYIAQNVRIGDRSVIEPNVTIYDNVEIGNDVIIRAGSVIGSEGLKCFRDGDVVISVKHAGKVRICDNVEIQSNCCIDKAIFEGSTDIGEYSKLDNFVHIAHNVKIGKRCLIAANATIAGYTRIGDDCWIGPSATISSSIKIGNNAQITIGTVVIMDVGDNEAVYLPRQQVSIPSGLSSKG